MIPPSSTESTRFVFALAIAASAFACGDDTGSGGASTTTTTGAPSTPAATSGSTKTGTSGNGASTTGTGSGTGGAPGETTPHVYVGGNGDKIAHYVLDRQTGALTFQDTYEAGSNPSFLAADPTHRFLYATNEGSPGRVLAFSIDAGTGALTSLNDRSSEGNGPAHVSVDPAGGHVFVANYGSGTIAALPIGADGSLGEATATESPGQNAHLILRDPASDVVYVPCLGSNHVWLSPFDAATGTFDMPPADNEFSLPQGSGPRHLAFHPTLRVLYVINELGDTVVAADIAADGTLTERQTLSTLESGNPDPQNACADIHVTADGKYLLGSNRGQNDLVVYAIGATGELTRLGNTSTGGDWPRNFGLDPGSDIVLVANQYSSTIVTFRLGGDGSLTELETTLTDDEPSWVGVVTQAAP